MRPRRFFVGLPALVALAVGVWWWRSPSDEWSCEDNSRIVCSVGGNAYDDEFSADSWRLDPQTFDTSTDRRRWAVALAPRERRDPNAVGSRLLINDPTTETRAGGRDRGEHGQEAASPGSTSRPRREGAVASTRTPKGSG